MSIQLEDVKRLRQASGAGFGDCKKALEACAGDFEAAIKHLRELGIASANKRSGREALEGRLFAACSSKQMLSFELACETDFVARNREFIAFGENLLQEWLKAGRHGLSEDEELSIKNLAAQMKENISLQRIHSAPIEANEFAVAYIHGEGRIATIVKIECQNASLKEDPRVKELASNLALHAAAFAPLYLSRQDVDAAYRAEYEDLFRKQAGNLGKPASVLEGIVQGKLQKHLASVCFLDQAFIKDEKLTVGTVISQLAAELAGTLRLSGFTYSAIGA